MTVKFRDTRSGRVQEMAEPPEIRAAGEAEAQRLAAKGSAKSKRAAELVAEQTDKKAEAVGRVLTSMDNSERWERVTDDPTPEPTPEPPKAKRAPAKPKADE